MSDLSDLRASTNETARVARTNLLFFLAVGLFLGLLAAGINDLLLLKRAEIILPLMDIGVPIDVFYMIGPVIFFLLHLNLLLRLARLYEVAHKLRKKIKTKRTRKERLFETYLLFPFDFLELQIHKIIRTEGPKKIMCNKPCFPHNVIRPNVDRPNVARPNVARPERVDSSIFQHLFKHMQYIRKLLLEYLKYVTKILFKYLKYVSTLLFEHLKYVSTLLFKYLKYTIQYLFQYLLYLWKSLYVRLKYIIREYGYFFTIKIIVLLLIVIAPLALLVYVQLTFLPYQSELITNFHRGTIAFDVVMLTIFFIWRWRFFKILRTLYNFTFIILGKFGNSFENIWTTRLKGPPPNNRPSVLPDTISRIPIWVVCSVSFWIAVSISRMLKWVVRLSRFWVAVFISHMLKWVVHIGRLGITATLSLMLIFVSLATPAALFAFSWFIAVPPDSVSFQPPAPPHQKETTRFHKAKMWFREKQDDLTQGIFNDWWVNGSCTPEVSDVKHTWLRRYLYLSPDTLISESDLPPEIVATYLAKGEISDNAWEFIDSLDLSNRSLRYGWFESNVFWRANFSGSDLHCTNFQNSKINGAMFRQTHADVPNAPKPGATDGRKFFRTKFHGADIRDSRFQDVNMGKMKFNDTYFVRTEFQGGKIHDSLFQNVNGNDLKFSGTDLSETKFHGGTIKDSTFHNVDSDKMVFLDIDLSRTRFHDSEIRNSTFQGIAGEEIEFVDIDLYGTTFHESDIKNAIFQGVQGEKMNFVDTDCTGTKFHGVDIPKASFVGTNLSNTEIHGSVLDGVEFKGTVLDDAEIYGVSADGVTFTGVYARNVDFYGTKMQKAQLTATNLYSSNFYASDLSMVDLSFVDVQQFGCVAPEKRENPDTREKIESKIIESLGERNISEQGKKVFLTKIKDNATKTYGSRGLEDMEDIDYDNQCVWADGYGPFEENFDLSEKCLGGLYSHLIENACYSDKTGMEKVIVTAVTDQEKLVTDEDISLPSHVAVKLLESSENGCNAITASHRIEICAYLKNWFSNSKSQSRETLQSHIEDLCGALPKNLKETSASKP